MVDPAKHLCVLFVEDSEDDILLLLGKFSEEGYETTYERVETPEAMASALLVQSWDIVISDHSMPQFNSLAALKLCRELRANLPFIIVSGKIGEETAVEAIKSGANDYLMKDNLHRLVPTVARCLAEGKLKHEHDLAQSALREGEERFRLLAANVPGMIYQLLRKNDGTFALPFVSEGSQGLFEIGPAEMQQNCRLLWELVVPEDLPGFQVSMNQSVESLAIWNWEGRIKPRFSSQIKWVNLRASPRRTPDGLVWDGIVSNITRSRLTERELKHSSERLRELSSHLQTLKEKERARFARELHDDLGGTLTAIKMELAWLSSRLPDERLDLQGKASSLQILVDRAIETTIRISQDLRPGILDRGIVAAIEWQAKDFQDRMSIPCEIVGSEEDIELDSERSVAIFRVFQETLTNISKYAQASKVHVKLGTAGGCVLLEVTDDGTGMTENDAHKPGSFGISGMIERCRHLGGELRIKSFPRKGTAISARIPLGRERESRSGAAGNVLSDPTV